MNSPGVLSAADDGPDSPKPQSSAPMKMEINHSERLPTKITNVINPNLMKVVAGVDARTFNKFICPSRILSELNFYSYT